MKIVMCLLLLSTTSAQAVNIPRAYKVIAQYNGIPVDVFFSMVLQESGKMTDTHQHLPWPWVLNIDHQGLYFRNRSEAEIALYNALSDSKKSHNIAVGLGQIYLPAHGHRFPNASLLLDPKLNLNYAAQLLATEYSWTIAQGTPDWWIAVGRYHHPSNHVLAQRYRSQVYQRCLKISMNCNFYGAGWRS